MCGLKRLNDNLRRDSAQMAWASEELHPLPVIHGDELGSALRLQRLQRAQQHPLFQTVELCADRRQLVSEGAMRRLKRAAFKSKTQENRRNRTFALCVVAVGQLVQRKHGVHHPVFGNLKCQSMEPCFRLSERGFGLYWRGDTHCYKKGP